MEQSKILELLESTGTLQRGHFELPDGIHTDTMIRSVKVMQFPPHCRKMAYEVVKHYWDMDVQLVIAASAESVLFAAEIARQLEARIVFSAQSKREQPTVLFQNFEIHAGDRAILIEDILTDDCANMKALARKILMADARLIGVGSLIETAAKATMFNVRQINVAKLNPKTWDPDECPLCSDA